MNNHPAIRSEQHKKRLIWVLLLLVPIIGMAVDLIAPSLPAISESLGVDAMMAKNVVTVYLLGYAIGNLISGFLADAYGRKGLLRFAIVGFAISSALPIIFPLGPVLFLSRLLQGLFLGTQSVVVRAILSDVLSPIELQSMGTMLGTMWAIGPIIGPVLGGYLQFYFGWQSGFIFFSLASVVLLVMVWRQVPETLLQKKALCFSGIKSDMFEVLKNRAFMGLVFLMGLAYALIIVFNTQAPFLVQDKLGYSSVFYGRFALFVGAGFLVATFVCRRSLKRGWSGDSLLFSSLLAFLIFFLASSVLFFFYPQQMIYIGITGFVAFFATGFIFPLSMGQGMAMFQHIAATATAIMFFVNVLLTTVSSSLSNLFHSQSAGPIVLVYLTLVVLSLVVYLLMVRGKLKIGK